MSLVLLDLSTLQFASLAGRVPFVILFALFCLKDEASAAYRLWTASLCASSLAMLLLFVSSPVHQSSPLFGAFAYGLTGMGVVLYQAGGVAFFGRRMRLAPNLALGLLPGLCYYAGRHTQPNIYLTMIPVAALIGITCLRAMLVFLRGRTHDGRLLTSQLVVSGALGAYALAMLVSGFIVGLRLATGTLDPAVHYPEILIPLVIDLPAAMLVNVALVTMSLEVAHNRLRRAASTDLLTGLANRRGILERATPLIGLSRRKQRPLSVLVVDIDHFKQVNDTHGHDAGDAVLAEFGNRMRQVLRRGQDVVGRWGGEEFVAVLPEQDEAEALALGERLRGTISARPFAVDGCAIALTASIGVAALEAADERLEAVVSRADAALYASKREGRNRVTASREAAAAIRPKPQPGDDAFSSGALPEAI